MKSIVTTYPDFQMLPKGVKRMLVASESFFFQDIKPLALATDASKPLAPVCPLPIAGHPRYCALAQPGV